jgi:hypothetical protein
MFACAFSWGLQNRRSLDSGGFEKLAAWRSLIEAYHSLDLTLFKPRLELSVYVGLPVTRRLGPPELRDPFQATAFVCWPGTPGIIPEEHIRTKSRPCFSIIAYHDTFPVPRNWSISTLSALGHARPALLEDVTARFGEI